MKAYFYKSLSACAVAAAMLPSLSVAEIVQVNTGAYYEEIGGYTFSCDFLQTGDESMNAYGHGASVMDWTSEAMNAALRAINTWDSVITNTPGRTLSVGLSWVDLSKTGALACAASLPYIDESKLVGDTVLKVQTKAETIWKLGQKNISFEEDDPYDIYVLCDSTSYGKFFFGDGKTDVPADMTDFESILFHEIGHGLGFLSYIEEGNKLVEDTYEDHDTGKTMTVTAYTTFDSLMVDKNGNPIVNETDGTVSLEPGETIELQGSELYVFNPKIWLEGSSGSHVTYGTGNPKDDADLVMGYSIGDGQQHRELSDAELKLMKVMGWSVIPEPATASLSCLALTLFMLRRRRMNNR